MTWPANPLAVYARGDQHDADDNAHQGWFLHLEPSTDQRPARVWWSARRTGEVQCSWAADVLVVPYA